jgi:hypothetical protein
MVKGANGRDSTSVSPLILIGLIRIVNQAIIETVVFLRCGFKSLCETHPFVDLATCDVKDWNTTHGSKTTACSSLC